MPKAKGVGHAGHTHTHQHHHKSHAEIMDKVKIKRVKRNKKAVTTSEKILTGVGVGSTLLGGMGAVSAQSKNSTQFVSTQNPGQNSGSSKIKSVIQNIFGNFTIPTAKADQSGETPAQTAARLTLSSGNFYYVDSSGNAVNSGQAATPDQLSAANQVYYGGYYNNQPSVTGTDHTGATANSFAGAQPILNAQGVQVGVVNHIGGPLDSTGNPLPGILYITLNDGTNVRYNLLIQSGDAVGMLQSLDPGAAKLDPSTLLNRIYSGTFNASQVDTSNGRSVHQVLNDAGAWIDAPKAGDIQINSANGGSIHQTFGAGGWTDTPKPGDYRIVNGQKQIYTAAGWPVAVTVTGITINGATTFTVGQSGAALPGATVAYSNGTTDSDFKTSGSVDFNTPGSYSITYTANKDTTKTKTISITVSAAQDTTHKYVLSADASSLSVDPGTTGGMTFTLRDNGQPVMNAQATAFSDNSKITVSVSGNVIAVAASADSAGQSATITISSGGQTATFSVTVTGQKSTYAQLASVFATTPRTQLTADQLQIFNDHFSNGQNLGDIPSSFSADSAFAFSLSLGGQTGNQTINGKQYTLSGNTWSVVTTSAVEGQTRQVDPATGQVNTSDPSKNVVTQTYTGGKWVYNNFQEVTGAQLGRTGAEANLIFIISHDQAGSATLTVKDGQKLDGADLNRLYNFSQYKAGTMYVSSGGNWVVDSTSGTVTLTTDQINKFATTPLTNFSQADQQAFLNFFANGKNANLIPTSFTTNSAIAYALSLGGQTGPQTINGLVYTLSSDGTTWSTASSGGGALTPTTINANDTVAVSQKVVNGQLVVTITDSTTGQSTTQTFATAAALNSYIQQYLANTNKATTTIAGSLIGYYDNFQLLTTGVAPVNPDTVVQQLLQKNAPPAPYPANFQPSTDPNVFTTDAYIKALNLNGAQKQANTDNANRYLLYQNAVRNWALNGMKGNPPVAPAYEVVDSTAFDAYWSALTVNGTGYNSNISTTTFVSNLGTYSPDKGVTLPDGTLSTGTGTTGSGGAVTQITNAAVSSFSFKNKQQTSNANFIPGEQWQADIVGTGGKNIYVSATITDATGKITDLGTSKIGTMSSNGTLSITGQVVASDVGIWKETWKIGDTQTGATAFANVNFTVLASRTPTGGGGGDNPGGLNNLVPAINTLSVNHGKAGDSVTITGSNFSTTGPNIVNFIGSGSAVVGSVTVTQSNGTSLTFTVPSNIAPGQYLIRVVSSSNIVQPSGTLPFTIDPANGGNPGGITNAPVVTSVTPASAQQGSYGTVRILGSYFTGATVVLPAGLSLSSNSNITVTSTEIDVPITVSATASVGQKTITITTPQGTTTANFTVTAAPGGGITNAPTITSVTPTTAPAGTTGTILISGTNLTGATLTLPAGMSLVGTPTISSTQISATIIISASTSVGDKTISVTTSQGTASVNFSVTAAAVVSTAPTITSVTPTTAPAGTTGTILISGTNLTGATLTLPDGITLVGSPTISNNQILANIAISSTTSVGQKTITVTTAQGTATVNFNVTAAPGGGITNAPTITSVTPTTAPAGTTGTILISGTNLTGATLTLPTGITLVGNATISNNQILATINIAAATTVGSKTITVTTAQGTATVNFNVTAAPGTITNSPTITSITPATAPAGTQGTITIIGTHLSGAVITLPDGFSYTSATTLTDTSIILPVSISSGISAGQKTILITTSQGSVTANFTVTAAPGGGITNAPTITSVTPTTAPAGTTGTILISGTNLTGATLTLPAGMSLVGNPSITNNQISATVTISATASVGQKTITVTTAQGTATVNFNITAAAGTTNVTNEPVVTSITPAQGTQGTTVNLTIVGQNLQGASLLDDSGDITFGNMTVNAAGTQATVSAQVSSSATLGTHTLILSTDNFDITVNFSVQAANNNGNNNTSAPTITTVTPSSAQAGTQTNIVISGTNLSGAVVTLPTGFSYTGTPTITGNQITLPVAISGIVAAGQYHITISNSQGAASANFTVTAATNNGATNEPVVSSITPGQAYAGDTVTLTLVGQNLQGASLLDDSGDITFGNMTVNAAGTQATVSAQIKSTATLGSHLLTLSTGDFDINLSFTVQARSNTNNPAPTVSSITPATAPAGTQGTIIINGANLTGATLVLPAGITLVGTPTISAGQISATISISQTFTPGQTAIGITTANGTTNVAFFVTAYVNPNGGNNNGGLTPAQLQALTLNLSQNNVNMNLGDQPSNVSAVVSLGAGQVNYNISASSSNVNIARVTVNSSNGNIQITAIGGGQAIITLHPTDMGNDTSRDKIIVVNVGVPTQGPNSYGNGNNGNYGGVYYPSYQTPPNLIYTPNLPPPQYNNPPSFQGLQMPPGYPASAGYQGLQYQDNNNQVVVDDSTPPANLGNYVVKKGDTLIKIAQKFYGKSSAKYWRMILNANPRSLSIPGNTRTLRIGYVLTIPSLNQ